MSNGRGRVNLDPDVITVEKSLGAVGYLNPRRATRPTGRFDSELESSVRAYQSAARLRKDGLINPGGRTITALVGRKAANMVPSRRVDDEAIGAIDRMVPDGPCNGENQRQD
ncbi:MAG: peptidoglycan hydrolase-like protein with peptidoglycan-binding domain [Alphaproteobacteria bacterium]|jgi:peptidoglycan hydrolase-like protein with peptidoglycan-binding domain